MTGLCLKRMILVTMRRTDRSDLCSKIEMRKGIWAVEVFRQQFRFFPSLLNISSLSYEDRGLMKTSHPGLSATKG